MQVLLAFPTVTFILTMVRLTSDPRAGEQDFQQPCDTLCASFDVILVDRLVVDVAASSPERLFQAYLSGSRAAVARAAAAAEQPDFDIKALCPTHKRHSRRPVSARPGGQEKPPPPFPPPPSPPRICMRAQCLRVTLLKQTTDRRLCAG